MTIPAVYPYGDLTFLELFPLIARFIGLGLKLIVQAIAYPFGEKKFTFRRALWRTFVQTICPNSTPRQMQWVVPRVGIMYEKFAKKNKMPILHEDIGDGASLHWIGSPAASLVILFFHGGGYVLPAVEGHFEMINYFRNKVSRNHEIDVSVAFLEYSLVNHAPWPKQLQQCVSAFSNLIRRGIHPSNIMLVGDSVGGHEVAFLLGHLLHPHPAAPPVKLSAPLAGAAMLSPWLSFSEDAPSFKRNAGKDLMPAPALRAWADMFKASRGDRKDDGNWFEPANAPVEWWEGLGDVVSNVMVTTATGECMMDDIVDSAERMRKGGGQSVKVETFVQDDAGHNEILAEFACGDEPGPSTHRVTNWIAKVFS